MGRGEDNDIVLPYDSVSLEHALLTVTRDLKCLVKDMKSTNGTRWQAVGGEAWEVIKPKTPASLTHGTKLRLGDVECTLSMGEDAVLAMLPTQAAAFEDIGEEPTDDEAEEEGGGKEELRGIEDEPTQVEEEAADAAHGPGPAAEKDGGEGEEKKGAGEEEEADAAPARGGGSGAAAEEEEEDKKPTGGGGSACTLT